MGMRATVLTGLVLAGCVQNQLPGFPADPYFTDLHSCRDRLNQAHYFIEPKIDGFYSVAIFPGGVQLNNEVGAVEVLKGDPPRINLIISTVPNMVIYKPTGGAQWQPASSRQENFPTTECNFQ